VARTRRDFPRFTHVSASREAMARKTVFIVSEDPAVRDSLAELVASAGLRAETPSSMDAWPAAAGPEPQGCLVLDAAVTNLVDPERLAMLASVCARIPVLVLIDRGDVPTAVRAMKQGAAYVLQKPPGHENLLQRIQWAVAGAGDGRATG
jgi:FixJ family two-component response regulator